MKFTISGFGGDFAEKNSPAPESGETVCATPRKSVVQVHFPDNGRTLAYYNDLFDLKTGDRVYVDGKLEGIMGCVTDVSYNFKIKLSDYHRVIARVDTRVHGKFYLLPSHFITFDPTALPVQKAASWFKAPEGEEETVSGSEDTSFPLEHLEAMGITPPVAERGHAYYMESRVRYLCLDGTKGFAIVEGSRPYTVEFSYEDGEIRNLLCDCYCTYPCKHEFAAMLQLREILDFLRETYWDAYVQSGYFAAILKETLFAYAVAGNGEGSVTF